MVHSQQEVFTSVKQIALESSSRNKVLLFGSRANKSARVDSDWDFLILLDKQKLENDDFDKISYPIIQLGWQEGEVFSPKLYTLSEWKQRSFTPFFKNVVANSVEL